MPELPSVEMFKRYFDHHALNKEILDITILNPEILINTSSDFIKEGLKGYKFISSSRYGKYLFAHSNHNLDLIMHFGMTGYLHSFQKKGSPHMRMIISFEDESCLAFDDARKFGKLGLTKQAKNFIEEKNLGEDALEIKYKSFREIFKGRKGKIKPLLMNQNFLAGIGNLYADEILYQTGIHPETHANQLSSSDLKDMFNDMKFVLEKAIEYQDSPRTFPDNFLLSHRHPGGKCPEGGKIKIIKVGGRTTYFCPDKQKLRI